MLDLSGTVPSSLSASTDSKTKNRRETVQAFVEKNPKSSLDWITEDL